MNIKTPVDARSIRDVREYDNGPRTPLADPSAILRACFFNRPSHDFLEHGNKTFKLNLRERSHIRHTENFVAEMTLSRINDIPSRL